MTTRRECNTIDKTVALKLCTGCGTCVGSCPEKAIAMKESPAGLLYPEIDYDKCICCGLCWRLCPGVRLAEGILNRDVDLFRGSVVAAFVGKVTDAAVLAGAQSGGIATALLSHLIKSGEIDQAIVTQMRRDGTLRTRTVVTRDIGEIRAARGSKYCPAAANASIRDISDKKSRVAIVGLPCHIHGLRNAQSLGLELPAAITLTIGLMCDRTLTFHAMEYLIEQSTANKNGVLGFEFRSKSWHGWPGDVCVHGSDGSEHFVSRKKRKQIKDVFTPVRCRLCFDKFNVLSDITLGDAWGYCKDEYGNSIILARSENGLNALLAAEKSGEISLKRIEIDGVFEKQGDNRKRRDWSCYTKAWEKMGMMMPDLALETASCGSTGGNGLGRYQRVLKRAVSRESLREKRQIMNIVRRHVFLTKLLSLPVIKRIVRYLRRRMRT